MAVKVPVGGLAASGESSPQQITPPLVRSAQAKPEPTLTDVKVPDGGEGMPGTRGARHWFQQSSSLLVVTPQAQESPELTDANLPDGGASTFEQAPPQQTTLPSVFTPQSRT